MRPTAASVALREYIVAARVYYESRAREAELWSVLSQQQGVFAHFSMQVALQVLE